MILSQLSGRERNIFFILVAVCCIYGVYAGVYQTLVVKRGEVESDIARARKQWTEQSRVIRRAKAMTAGFSGDMESFRQTGTNEAVMSGILAEIGAAANGMSIRVTEIKPIETKKEDFYNRFSVSLTVEGELKDVLRFIHALQGDSHYFTVSQLSLERAYQGASQMAVRLVVNRVLVP
jgi:Tfp pilus assembly protein PilO